MKKFDNIISRYLKEEAPMTVPPSPGGMPDATGGQPGIPPENIQAAPPVEPETTQMTSAGEVMYVMLALECLGIDPENLDQHERAILNTEVTPENAKDIASQIRTIAQAYGYPAT